MLPSNPCRSRRTRKASTVMCRSARSRSPCRSTYPSTPPTHSVSNSASTHSSSPRANNELPSSSCRRSSNDNPPTKLTTAAVSGSCVGFRRTSRAASAAAAAAARRASRRTREGSFIVLDPTGASCSYVRFPSPLPLRSSARTKPRVVDSFSCASTARKVSPVLRSNRSSSSSSFFAAVFSFLFFFFFAISSSASTGSSESDPRRMLRANLPRNPPRFLGRPSRIACASECTSIASGPASTPLRSS